METFRSEIRDSTLQALEERVSKGRYQRYLKRLTMKRLRSFTDREVTFDFPVTALIGPNGGGKTTILGAAALIYRDTKPRTFFAKSGKYDKNMKDWAVEYELIDRELSPRITIQRTASFLEHKWNRRAVEREVLPFGVARTVPATERRELTKAIGSKFSAKREVAVTRPVALAVEKILGKDIHGYNRLFVDASGKVQLYAARSPAGDEYSEFHFGAGEASVIRIVSDIEAACDGSLILIGEIENGLHPVATRRMVEYLIDVADRKSCQVIFTTHSNDALDPLPPKAIWAAYNSEVLQGKLDISALRTITGQIDARLAIFVEDEFAARLVSTALRYSRSVELDAVKVHGMGGATPAIQVNEQHNLDPTATFPSICLLDGDQPDLVDSDRGIYLLPGDRAPEAHVFDAVMARLDSVVARLTVHMQLPPEEQEWVKRIVRERARTNRDRHVIYEQIGEDLDFTAGYIVSGAFLSIWAQQYPGEVESLLAQFVDVLPRKAGEGLSSP